MCLYTFFLFAKIHKNIVSIIYQNNNCSGNDITIIGINFSKIRLRILADTKEVKMSKYITETERYKIETMLQDGIKPREIAQRIGKHYTTIYREIKRGTVTLVDTNLKEYKKYCADVAQRKQEEASHNKGIELKIGSDYNTIHYMESLIKEYRYSAYAVSTMLRQCNTYTSLCPQTIYNYIKHGIFLNVDKNDYIYNKVHKKEIKTNRRPSLKMLGAKTIEERPEEVNKRNTFGHWELDTVYSGKNKGKECLLVFTERFTRLEIIRKIPDRTAESVVTAINKIETEMGLEKFKKVFKTITCDNGVEFTKHKEIETSCINNMRRTFLYFCHAFCSSERGSNENANKLIRKYIPKGADIGEYTDAYIQEMENAINNYPRKLFKGLSTNKYMQAIGL